MTPEEKKAAFVKTPFCKGLADEIINEIASAAVERSFAKGEALVKAGDEVDGLHLIISGQASVINSFAGDSKTVGMLKPFEVMGEVALIGGQKRASTVVADEPVQTLLLPSADFKRLSAAHSEIVEHLEKLGQRRTTTNLEIHLGDLPDID